MLEAAFPEAFETEATYYSDQRKLFFDLKRRLLGREKLQATSILQSAMN
jgi:hypothetical protein